MSDDTQYRVEQFKKFHTHLMSNAPKDYEPWYIPVTKENKAVDGRVIYHKAPTNKSCCNIEWVKFNRGKYSKTICKKCGKTRGSWKQPWARLTFNQCIGLISVGYNIGLAARSNDMLCIIDIDNYTKAKELPLTLTNKSRKRCGLHGFYWSDKPIPNIPTEDCGEVRSQDQYVIVSGYVPTDAEAITEELKAGHITIEQEKKILQDPYRGFYSVEIEQSPNTIEYEQLPDFFKEANEKQSTPNKAALKTKTVYPKGKRSALYDLTMKDLCSVSENSRVGHPLHSSDTDANFSMSDDLVHCWRHTVSLNALQFLVVKSGYMGCAEAGTGHHNGNSSIVGDDGAIFHAWKQAKQDKVISEDDPIPIRAMCYIAMKHNLCDAKDLPSRLEKKSIPWRIYNKVVEVVENEY